LEQSSSATPYKGEGADVLKYSTANNLNASQGSIEFWFKPDWAGNDGTTHYLFDSNPQDGTNKDKLALYKDSTNALFFDIYDHGGTNYKRASIATDGTNLTAGAWHHLIATYNSNQPVNIFLDGVKSTNALIGSGTGTTAVPYTFLIGSKWNNATSAYINQANATIDNLRIYNRVLSDNEIIAHYNATDSEAENIGIISNLKMHEPSDGTAIWSQLDWTNSLPSGTNVKFRTRSATTEGNLVSAVWSGYNSASGSAITGTPDNPWIEIEVSLWTTSGTATPTLSSFQLTYNVNAPPVITVNSATQNTDGANFGKVIINYGITDVDDTTEQVYLFYQPQVVTLSGAIQATDPPPQTINVNITTGFPSSGILSIGLETFTYDSKTSTSFHITARHTTQNEKAQAHYIGEAIFVKAQDANVTGGGAKTLNAGSPNSLTNQAIAWDVKTELPNAYYPTAKIRVLGDDNEFVYSTGTGDSSALVIDTISPTSTSLKIANDAAYMHAYTVNLNLAATDNSAKKVKISNNVDLSADGLNNNSGQWLDYASTISNWNLPQNGDGTYTVYYQFMDIYGNTVTATSDTIIKSTPPAPAITSATQGPDGKVTILYNLTDAIVPPTGQTKFNIYLKYAADGINFTLASDTYLTDELGQPLNVTSAGNGKTIIWDPTVQFPNLVKLSGQHKLRLIVDDQNPSITVADPTAANLNFSDANILERIAKSDYTAFKLDTASPTGTYITINNNDAYTHNSTVNLNLAAADDSNVKVKISNNQNLSADGLNSNSGMWLDFDAIINDWNLVAGDGAKTVYYQFKDEFGNTVALNNDTIVKSSPPTVAINSVVEQSDGSVQIKYALTDMQAPPTGQTYFNIYAKYSNTGNDLDLTTIGSIDPTAISDNTAVNVADGSEQTITWYPTKETFSNNLYKNGVSQKLVLYADDLNSAVAVGNAERFTSASTADFILDTAPPAKTSFYTDANNDGNNDDYTQSSNIKLLIASTDDSTIQYRFKNGSLEDDNTTPWSILATSPLADNVASYDLITGEGQKTVYGQLSDAYGNVTSFQKNIYKVSTPTVNVNSVAQSVTPETYGKVYIDYTISDALYDSLNVTMKYCMAGCDDGANWHDVNNVTNTGAQAVTPGEDKNIVSEWDAESQLNGTESDNARFRVYASNGIETDDEFKDETMYNPADELGGGSNDVTIYDPVILDYKAGTANGNAITISGKIVDPGQPDDNKIGQIQLDQGIKLNLSVNDISYNQDTDTGLYVQFSNDGVNYGTSVDQDGKLNSTYHVDVSQNEDDFAQCNSDNQNKTCSWLTYKQGDGLPWTPDMSNQGNITVYMRLRDTYGNIGTYTDTAILDTVSPDAPNFNVADSSLYGVRYMVTISWDLFRQAPANQKLNPDTQEYVELNPGDPEYVDPQSQAYADQVTSHNNYDDLANTGNAYILQRKILDKDGNQVGIDGRQTNKIDEVYWSKSTTYAEGLPDYDYIDRLRTYTYDENNQRTYYYRLVTRDSVGNTSENTSEWKTLIPQGINNQPPEITIPISSNVPEVVAGDTTATISWLTTNISSNSMVQFSADSEYDANKPEDYKYTQGDPADFVTTHTVVIIGLTPETTYHYRVRSESKYNAVGYSVPDKTFTTTVPNDSLTHPTIYTPEVQASSIKPTSANITWKTGKPAYAQVVYGTDQNNLDLKTILTINLNTDQFAEIADLTPKTKYYFKARAVDTYGNESFGPLQDFTTPEEISIGVKAAISGVVISDITMNSAVVSWTSVSINQYEVAYGKSASYGDTISDKSSSGTTIHTVKLQNLEQGISYHFRINGTDDVGTSYLSDDYVFDTITLPQIKGIKFADVTEDSLTVSWTTNVATDSQVEYKINATDTPRIEAVTDLATAHSVKLQNLDSNVTYSIRVIVRDSFGNQAISLPMSVKTNVDTTAPKILQVKAETAASLSQDGKVQAIISWQTDEPSTTQVVYSLGSQGNYDKQSQKDENLTNSHLVIIPELVGASTYHYKVVSDDKAGNEAKSNDYTILTPRKKNSLLQIILNNMEQQFGWLRKFGVFQ